MDKLRFLKTKIGLSTVLLMVAAVWPVVTYADTCHDNAQSIYQPLIDQATKGVNETYAARGLSSSSPQFQVDLQAALQPIENSMNSAISQCEASQIQVPQVNIPAPNNPTPTQAPVPVIVVAVTPAPTPQPTNSPQVTQAVETATPTPTASAYLNYKPTPAPHYTSTPTSSPTVSPSASSTKINAKKLTQQNSNFFQNIAHFFENVFHWITTR